MKKILFSLLCSLFLFTACSDDDERSDVAPYIRIPDTVKALHYLKDVQRENVKIETNVTDWTITSDQSWCDAHRISSNPQMFRLELDENVELDQREAKLTLKAGGITESIIVKQLGSKPAILVNPEKIELSDTKADYELVITTNVSSFKWEIPENDKSWLNIEKAPAEDLTRAMVESKYILTARTNLGMKRRTSTIVFTGTGDEEEHPVAELFVTQKQRSTDVDDVEMGEDTKVKPGNGWASTEHSSQPIANSFDGYKDDAHQPYHSLWGDPVTFPVSLEYYFDGTQDLDYILYFANANGKFKKVDLYYLDGGDVISFDQNARPAESPSEGRNWVKINKTYNLMDVRGGQRIIFPERLTNVLGIKLVINSTYDNVKVACDEMEFYRSNASHLEVQLLGIFKDITCCELNDGITDEQIDELPGYFAQLAYTIKEGRYSDWEKKFRIQDYKPYSDVFETAEAMLIKKYGTQDNITGISVEAGEEIFILVGDTHGNDVYLQVLGEETVTSDAGQYVQTEGPPNAQTTQLLEGVNKVVINKTGMLFILYSADPTNEANKPIHIHIPYASGKVSGFFDLETDKTDDVYAELLSKAEYKYFGVRGKEIIFYFHTSQLRKVAPNNIVKAIELWDNIVGWEHEIMGFTGDLRARYNNHVVAISPEGGYMWQSEYRVGFVYTYLKNILLPENVLSVEDNAWGPAHEIGHIHQKAINWPGCSESSNNLFSNYVIHKMGKYHSRGYGLCRVAKTRFVDNDPWVLFGEKTHQEEDTEIHMRMYWQLFVYYHLCRGNNDFWPTVFANMRNSYPGGYTETDPGSSQMKFVKAVCAAANEDLTDFFDFWGFFTPYSGKINQYGNFNYNVTAQMITDTKNEIASRYSKKAAPIQYIEDRKKEWFSTTEATEYRDTESGDVGYYKQFIDAAVQIADNEITATVSGKEVTVNPTKEAKAVAFEVRNGSNRDGKLVYFSNDYKFTLPDNIKTNEVSLWAVQADGARKSIQRQ